MAKPHKQYVPCLYNCKAGSFGQSDGEMPKTFQHKSEDYAQKSVYKKKSEVDKSHHRDIVIKHLGLESSDNAKANAIIIANANIGLNCQNIVPGNVANWVSHNNHIVANSFGLNNHV